jgi:hypothetical protein
MRRPRSSAARHDDVHEVSPTGHREPRSGVRQNNLAFHGSRREQHRRCLDVGDSVRDRQEVLGFAHDELAETTVGRERCDPLAEREACFCGVVMSAHGGAGFVRARHPVGLHCGALLLSPCNREGADP